MYVCVCVTQDLYRDLAPGAEAEGSVSVSVAGRVMNKRVMGKLAFLTLRDDRGQIQVRVHTRTHTHARTHTHTHTHTHVLDTRTRHTYSRARKHAKTHADSHIHAAYQRS